MWQVAGGTTNLRDTSRSSGPREERDDDGSRSGVNRDNTEPVADALATIAAMDAAQERYVPGQVTTRERPITQPASPSYFGDLGSSRDDRMDYLVSSGERTARRAADLLASMSDVDESDGDFAGVAPVTAPPVDMPGADPMNDLLFGEGRIDVPIIDPRADRDSVTPMEQFYLDQEAKAAAATQPSIDQNLLTSLDLGPNV